MPFHNRERETKNKMLYNIQCSLRCRIYKNGFVIVAVCSFIWKVEKNREKNSSYMKMLHISFILPHYSLCYDVLPVFQCVDAFVWLVVIISDVRFLLNGCEIVFGFLCFFKMECGFVIR